MQNTGALSEKQERAAAMGLLARSDPAHLADLVSGLGTLPAYRHKRAPQTGLIMARGRAGATGDAFNLGEVSATRATVVLETGEEGHGYVLGRDKAHAERVALCDALLQSPAGETLGRTILQPLIEAEAARHAAQARRAAATRVEFFTLSRER